MRWRLATGENDAAKKSAEEWLLKEPKASAAHEALGDAWRAQGNAAEALTAYNRAVQFLPKDVEPLPAGLFAKITALTNAAVETLPKQAARPPTAEEMRYFAFIESGDKAMAAEKPDVARQRYAEAAAWRKEKRLSIAPLELEDVQVVSAQPAAVAVSTQSVPVTSKAVTVPATTAITVGVSAASAPAATDSAPAVGLVVSATELIEAKILADANGQWVSSATASSEYGSPGYGAVQLVGAPNVNEGGDSTLAWCHGRSAKGLQWIEVSFAKPVRATEVRVRQNYNAGAIVKVEAIDAGGVSRLWWSGIDPARGASEHNAIAWFGVRVPKAGDLVAKVRVTLDVDAVASWQEIDAVQLVGASE